MTLLFFNSKNSADGYKNQHGFTPEPENSDSTSCPSMLFLKESRGTSRA
jgi:hypothetical protein